MEAKMRPGVGSCPCKFSRRRPEENLNLFPQGTGSSGIIFANINGIDLAQAAGEIFFE
jgi:hypothetical protein